jgi:hypothetical protein
LHPWEGFTTSDKSVTLWHLTAVELVGPRTFDLLGGIKIQTYRRTHRKIRNTLSAAVSFDLNSSEQLRRSTGGWVGCVTERVV